MTGEDLEPRYDADGNRIDTGWRYERARRVALGLSEEAPPPHGGADGNRVVDRRRHYEAVRRTALGLSEGAPAPHEAASRYQAVRNFIDKLDGGSGVAGLLAALTVGGFMWSTIVQGLPEPPKPSPAPYEARFDAIDTWREEAIAIIDETIDTWDETTARYGPGCPPGVNTPPCPFIRGYDTIARTDFESAREALSTETLAAQRELTLHQLERNGPNAAREARAELEALERLHPVCLRWYTAEATTREAVRWAFQCPDESDPRPTPDDDDIDLIPNPLSPLNPLYF